MMTKGKTPKFDEFNRFIYHLINELPKEEAVVKDAIHRAVIKTRLEQSLEIGK